MKRDDLTLTWDQADFEAAISKLRDEATLLEGRVPPSLRPTRPTEASADVISNHEQLVDYVLCLKKANVGVHQATFSTGLGSPVEGVNLTARCRAARLRTDEQRATTTAATIKPAPLITADEPLTATATENCRRVKAGLQPLRPPKKETATDRCRMRREVARA